MFASLPVNRRFTRFPRISSDIFPDSANRRWNLCCVECARFVDVGARRSADYGEFIREARSVHHPERHEVLPPQSLVMERLQDRSGRRPATRRTTE